MRQNIFFFPNDYEGQGEVKKFHLKTTHDTHKN